VHPRALARGAAQDAKTVRNDERSGQRLLQAKEGEQRKPDRQRSAN
jgi:hypothetical protein